MAKDYPQLSVSNRKLLFHLSLAYNSSENVGRRPSDDDAADFDDEFVFDIDPSLLVDRDKLTIGDMIGEGSYSIVYKGWWAPLVATYECRPVAIKVIHPERTMDATPECKAKFQREVKLLSRIEHKNIVKFIGASVKPSMMIITELLEGGSLQKNLKMSFGLELSLCYALDISQAMEYLHTNGIIHRDLKPGNLLLTEDKMHVKLADFGIAREDTCDEMTCEAGSYRYMAPELFSKDPLRKGEKKCYDRKADVYSFAIVLWSLIKNQTPFKERKGLMAAYATANNLRPSVDGFPKYLLPLLQSCWAQDPKLRPEFTEITKTLMTIRCSTKTSALASINEIEELDSNESMKAHGPTSLESKEENIPKHDDDETIKPNGDTEGDSQSQSQSRAQTLFPESAKSNPKKKSNLKRLFTCFRSCFSI